MLSENFSENIFLLHLHSLFSLLLYSTIEGYSTCLLNGITLFCMILDCIKDFLLPYSSDFGRRKAMKKLCLENHSCYHPINSIKYICYINLIDVIDSHYINFVWFFNLHNIITINSIRLFPQFPSSLTF